MTAIDPTFPVWPRILAPRDVEPQMNAPFMAGPSPGIGAPQRVQNQAGLWRLSLMNIPLYDNRILLYRAILARMVTTGGALYMPMWEWSRAASPVPATGAAFQATAAALSWVSVTPPAIASVSVGRIIGIGDRAHLIYDIEPDSTAKKLYIWPPLRDAVAIGDPIEFGNPICRMRADIDQVKQSLGSLSYGRVGFASIDFVEDNW